MSASVTTKAKLSSTVPVQLGFDFPESAGKLPVSNAAKPRRPRAASRTKQEGPSAGNKPKAASTTGTAMPVSLPDPTRAPATTQEAHTVQSASPKAECAVPLPAALPRTLAEVFGCLENHSRLNERPAADMRSALRVMERVCSVPLQAVAADAAVVRRVLDGANPATAGVSRNRWMRVRSLITGALSATGVPVMPGRYPTGMSHAWATLHVQLPNLKLKVGLSRLLRFLTQQGIEPSEVDAAALTRFQDGVMATSLRANPQATSAMVMRLWQKAAALVPGWPELPTLPSTPSRRYALPLTAFADSFQADVTAFLAHSADQDPFADDYAPSVRPITVEMRRKQILQVASALTGSGFAMHQITTLAVLVEPTNAKAALRYILERRGGTKGVGVASQAQLLRTIARHWVRIPEGDIQKLRGFVSALTPKREGMTRKNSERLRQFDLKANVYALLGLTNRVVTQVEKAGTGSRRDALRLMLAVVVELLLVAPMRMDNLCGLEIEKHLVEVRRGRHRLGHISIPTTKTRVRFDRGLPADTSRILETYITTYRSRLCAEPSTMLFPGKAGGKRAGASFSAIISNFIRKETGLAMNPHLFRHLAVKLHLDRCPDEMETARLILGHTSSRTTERSYTEGRTDHAFRRWDQTLTSLRQSAIAGTSMPLSLRSKGRRA